MTYQPPAQHGTTPRQPVLTIWGRVQGDGRVRHLRTAPWHHSAHLLSCRRGVLFGEEERRQPLTLH